MERSGFVGFALVIALFAIGFTNDIGRLTGEGFSSVSSSVRQCRGNDRWRAHRAPSARAATLAEAFRITARTSRDRVAVRTKDDEVSLTWAQLRERVDALAGGLARARRASAATPSR